MTISARSTSSRSSSSRRISESSRSKGPAKTSRSSSSSARRTVRKAMRGCGRARRPSPRARRPRPARRSRGPSPRRAAGCSSMYAASSLISRYFSRVGVSQLGHFVADRGLEVAVAGALEVFFDLGGRDVADDREDLDQVRDARLVVADDDLVAAVGQRAAELLDDRLGLLVDVDGALGRPAGGRHLALGLLEVAHAGADRRDVALGDHEVLAEALVERLRDVAHELDVLALVLPHRHLVGAVDEHVGGHQHRVIQQPRGRPLARRARLVAELVHAVELPDRRHARQQPRQLGVLGDVALAEEDAALGVEPGGHQQGRGLARAPAQLLRVVGDRRAVQVDDAVDRRVRLVLTLDVVEDRPDVVAEVLAPGGLDAGEDDH